MTCIYFQILLKKVILYVGNINQSIGETHPVHKAGVWLLPVERIRQARLQAEDWIALKDPTNL